MNKAFAVLSV